MVGVQLAVWTLTGLYMTAVHIDIIHGDHFIREAEPPSVPADRLISPADAGKTVGQPERVRLSSLVGRLVYVVEARDTQIMVDAMRGGIVPTPSKEQIRQIALERFKGDEQLKGLSLISDIPGEIRGRRPPLWRADFTGWNKPTLYISPVTGELVSRRHELWRVFDFLWMLHIMDYEERENVNNLLLRGMTLLALVTVFSGAWLLYFAFPRRRRKAGAR